MTSPVRLATRLRVARHRVGLRDRGLRPIQLLVPDSRAEGFWDEARRQALAIAAQPSDDLAFAEAAQYWPERA